MRTNVKKTFYTIAAALIITGGVSAASFNPPTSMQAGSTLVMSDGTMPIPICRPGYCGVTK
jgi:hypothetical protein